MPGGIVIALFEERSLYDTTPAIATFGKIFGTVGYKKHVALSAVDANTGEKVYMTDETVPFNELPTAVLGSASVPIAFPPTEYGGHRLMDGMTAYNTDVQATIDRCKELGVEEENITIDVLSISDPGTVTQLRTSPHNAILNFRRQREINSAYHGTDTLESTKKFHPKINWRHDIIQSKKVGGFNELSFEQDVVQPLIATGKQDALQALQAMEAAQLVSSLFLS